MSKKKPTFKKSTPIYPLQSTGRESRGATTEKGGMRRFSFHSSDAPVPAANLLSARALTAGAATPNLAQLDSETAARYYLEGGLASSELPTFSSEEVNGEQPEFQSLGTEKLPLTGTQFVKFRQAYRKIPVYGSLV